MRLPITSILIAATAVYKSYAANSEYPTCKYNSVIHYTDSDGDWSVEDGEWCLIDNSVLAPCWSTPLGYPCCTDPNATVLESDESGDWGIENNDWCGIIKPSVSTTTTTIAQPTTITSTTTIVQPTTTTTVAKPTTITTIVAQQTTVSQNTVNNAIDSSLTGNFPVVNLKDGWYYIKGYASGKYLQVQDNKAEVSQNVEIGSSAQKWKITNTDDGYVTITSGLGDFNLDVELGEDKDGSNLIIFPAYGGDAQKFVIKSSPSNSSLYAIVTKVGNGNKVLDVSGMKKDDGTNVLQYTSGNKSNQLWIFESITDSSTTTTTTVAKTTTTIAQPTTTIVKTTTTTIAQPTTTIAQPTTTIAQPTATVAQPTTTVTQTITTVVQPTATINQNSSNEVTNNAVDNSLTSKYPVVNLKDGWYYIKGYSSGKYLQAQGNIGASHQNVEIGSYAQKWKITNTKDGYVTITSGLGEFNLDVVNGEDKDGANLIIYKAYGGDSQKFVIKSSTGNSNLYTIVTKVSNGNKVLDVAGKKKDDGTNVLQYTCGGQENQFWIFESTTAPTTTTTAAKTTTTVAPQPTSLTSKYPVANLKDGWYYIKGVASGKYLQVQGNIGYKRQNVEIGSTPHKWKLTNVGDGYVTLTSGLGNFNLDIVNGEDNDNVNLIIFDNHGGDAQQFVIKSSPNNSKQYFIVTKISNGNRVVDVAGRKTTDGTNVLLYTSSGQENQLWTIESVDNVTTTVAKTTTTVAPQPTSLTNKYKTVKLNDGWYYIKGVASGKYLQVQGNIGYKRQNVEIGSTPTKWKLTNTKDGYITLTSGLGNFNLDIKDGENKDGANIIIFDNHGGDAQQFVLKASPSNSKQYFIVTKISNGDKVIDVTNKRTADGTNVLQYTSSGQDNQLWTFENALLKPVDPSLTAKQNFSKPVAFPGADGGGKFATGGRGGEVVYVTNLNDSGPGSLRDAVSKSRRIVVFSVSGTIELKSDISIKGDITIAGQTAPGGHGVVVKNFKLGLAGNNIIVRFIGSRPGERGSSADYDAWGGAKGANSIIDHCSIGWANDEQWGLYSESDDLTVQYTVIGPSNSFSYHSKGIHGFGIMLGRKRVSYHHNLIAHNVSRNFRGKVAGSEPIDFTNNVIYNWGSQTTYGTIGHVNYVGNTLKRGPNTKSGNNYVSVGDSGTHPELYSIYLTGNRFLNRDNSQYNDFSYNNWRGIVYKDGSKNEGNTRSNSAFVLKNGSDNSSTMAKVEPADRAYDNVLNFAGNGIASNKRIEIDQQVANEARTGGGSLVGARPYNEANSSQRSEIDKYGIKCGVKFQYPGNILKSSVVDSDGDGMPDDWEIARGLNPKSKYAADGSLESSGDYCGRGYTNIEYYLNDLTIDAFPSGVVKRSPTLKEL